MNASTPTRPAREDPTMDRYEYPPDVQFNAPTPERAAVQAFGGRESDYVTTEYGNRLEVITADGVHVGEIPIVR